MQLSDDSLLKTSCYIDDRWLNSESGEKSTVVNPATGEKIGWCGTTCTTSSARGCSR